MQTPADSAAQFLFDQSLLTVLACPACQSELRLKQVRLVCAACGRAFPIVHGIPVLIAERAENGP